MATGFCAVATGTSDVLEASATISPAAIPNPRSRTIPSLIIRSLSLQSVMRDARVLNLDADPPSATAKTCSPRPLLWTILPYFKAIMRRRQCPRRRIAMGTGRNLPLAANQGGSGVVLATIIRHRRQIAFALLETP